MLAAEVVLKVNTGLGAFDVALRVTLPEPIIATRGTVAANWMTCTACVTVKLCWTWGAAV